jgi:D-alanyl-D-alanine carboxypeptidase
MYSFSNSQIILKSPNFQISKLSAYFQIILLLVPSLLYAQKLDILPHLKEIQKAYEIPSIAIAVMNSDSIIAMEAYGLRRKDNKKDSVQLEDRYHLGSNSKAFTAYWAALLVERGLIDWETALLDIFPEWKPLIHQNFHKMKFYHFLNHRSGIKPYMKSEEFAGVPWMRDSLSPTQHRIIFSKWAMREKPKNVPTYKYEYSNANYCIVAAMLEKVSGMSWETAMKKEVAERIGIRIEFGWPHKLGKNEPLGHFDEKHKNMVQLPQLSYSISDYLAPAADINASIRDYAFFVLEHLRAIKGMEGYDLKTETYQKLLYGYPAYSIGWINNQSKNISSHDGYAGSFYAHVSVFRDKDIAFVILMNSGARKHIRGMYELRRRILGVLGK